MTDDQKLALERYRNVLSYLQYEQAIYWTRVGFVIAAQAGFIAFGGRLIYETIANPTKLSLAVSIGICCIAFTIGVLGLRTTKGSLRWIYRWQEILRGLEPNAYGDIEVFRGTPSADGLPTYSVRAAANHILYVFMFAWAIMAIAVAWSYLASQ